MITARTKRQLLIFVIITLVGVSYVGARYARLDRVFYDPTYTVTAAFSQSGGIFTDAEVTYRGVQVGRVGDLQLTSEGVDVVLDIENGFDDIPADSLAVVGNKSAVGEQYVELQPQSDAEPFLEEGSEIANADTDTPVQTSELLTNLSNLVSSVPQADLRTVINEAGAAFDGTGPELSRIIETQNSFITRADQEFATTQRLIRDGRTVLRTQVDKGSAIRSFAEDLRLFTGTVADSDADLRRLIEQGSATSVELRTFLEQNQVNLGELINNLVTTNEVVSSYLPGIRQLLVIYPYVVAGGYTVTLPADERSDGFPFNAQFGLALQPDPPVCAEGYVPPRPATGRGLEEVPMPEDVGCTDPSRNLRGAEKAPGPNAPGTLNRPPVATYDRGTGEVTWADEDQPEVVYDGGAQSVFGGDSWKWMLVAPSMADPPR